VTLPCLERLPDTDPRNHLRQPTFQHFHLRIDALARLPSSDLSAIGFILAQNDFLRELPSGCGALRFDPVAAFILALPLAVNPAPWLVGSFSPRPTEREGVLAI